MSTYQRSAVEAHRATLVVGAVVVRVRRDHGRDHGRIIEVRPGEPSCTLPYVVRWGESPGYVVAHSDFELRVVGDHSILVDEARDIELSILRRHVRRFVVEVSEATPEEIDAMKIDEES